MKRWVCVCVRGGSVVFVLRPFGLAFLLLAEASVHLLAHLFALLEPFAFDLLHLASMLGRLFDVRLVLLLDAHLVHLLEHLHEAGELGLVRLLDDGHALRLEDVARLHVRRLARLELERQLLLKLSVDLQRCEELLGALDRLQKQNTQHNKNVFNKC